MHNFLKHALYSACFVVALCAARSAGETSSLQVYANKSADYDERRNEWHLKECCLLWGSAKLWAEHGLYQTKNFDVTLKGKVVYGNQNFRVYADEVYIQQQLSSLEAKGKQIVVLCGPYITTPHKAHETLKRSPSSDFFAHENLAASIAAESQYTTKALEKNPRVKGVFLKAVSYDGKKRILIANHGGYIKSADWMLQGRHWALRLFANQAIFTQKHTAQSVATQQATLERYMQNLFIISPILYHEGYEMRADYGYFDPQLGAEGSFVLWGRVRWRQYKVSSNKDGGSLHGLLPACYGSSACAIWDITTRSLSIRSNQPAINDVIKWLPKEFLHLHHLDLISLKKVCKKCQKTDVNQDMIMLMDV